MASSQVNIEQQKRIRETVLDKIAKIDPYTRPFMASIGRKDINGTKPEWTKQTLEAPSATNKKVHGYTTAFAAANWRARDEDFNYTQLMSKPVAVDLSHEAVDVAGIPKGGELPNQKGLKFEALLNDVEYMGVSNNSKTQPLPNQEIAGQSAGAQTFITTNHIQGGTTAYPEKIVTPQMWTDMQVKIRAQGGKPNKALMGLQALDTVSGWVKQVTREVGNDARRVTQVVEQIRGLAGLIDLLYSSALPTVILELETGRWEWGWLREPKWYPYPDGISDFHGGDYKAEVSLIAWQEKSSGKVSGLVGYTV